MVLSGLSLFDVVLSIVYILMIIFISLGIKSSLKNVNYGSYLMPFVGFKILCAILFVLIHIYVYRGGDTFLYFAGSKFIAKQISAEPTALFSFLFGPLEAFTHLKYTDNFNVFYFFGDATTLFQCQIGAPFAIFGFREFLASNILFSVFSASGVWALYSTLCKLYPKLYKVFAIGVLFYPTIGIWGSGLLKDPVVLAAIGWLFQAIYNISERKKIIQSSSLIVLSIILCLQLKPYVLYTFIPAMLLWLQARFSSSIKNSFLRYFITPIILLSTFAGGYYFLITISQSAGKYSLENVQQIAEGFQNWHTYLADTRDQSGYSLGEVNFTPLGILKKTPEALFVTYYRPIPFEIRNAATAFESVQSTILLFITIYIIFKVGLSKFFRIIISNKEVRAFMIFAILLGIAVGLTSYNFGALSRYKIPGLPFYTSALAIIYYIGTKKRKRGTDISTNSQLKNQ